MPKAYPPEKREEWTVKIREQKESGLSATKWCQKNQVALSTFFYWKSRLFPEMELRRSNFLELADTTSTGIILECLGARIFLDKNFESSALKRCLRALKEMKC